MLINDIKYVSSKDKELSERLERVFGLMARRENYLSKKLGIPPQPYFDIGDGDDLRFYLSLVHFYDSYYSSKDLIYRRLVLERDRLNEQMKGFRTRN